MALIKSWQPLGDKRDATVKLLGAAVRGALPHGTGFDDPVSTVGELRFEVNAAKQNPGQPQLARLHWRLMDSVMCEKRAMRYWLLDGEAFLETRKLFFRGEFLQDRATGMFRHFLLQLC